MKTHNAWRLNAAQTGTARSPLVGSLILSGILWGTVFLAAPAPAQDENTTWSATASLNTARYYHTATMLNNGMVLVAGVYNGSYLTSAELYDPATGTWSATGSLNTARYIYTATLLNNGKVLVSGGYNGSYLA